MQEVDIWINVFEKLDLKFDDELHNRHSGTNCLKYNRYTADGTYFERYHIWFIFETGVVTNLQHYNITSAEGILLNKERFMEKHKDLFREVKLTQLL